MSQSLSDLYDRYNKLADAKDVTQLSDEYEACFEGTKGDDKEKMLAAQIISKYFKYFPALQEQALNALLDLCEDGQIEIRICAMKVLPLLCKDSKAHIFKIADSLAQLLQLEKQDYTVACNCLSQVFKEEPVTVCKAIFNVVHSSSDDTSREKCISYLFQKLIKIPEKLTTEIEDTLIEEGKKLLRVCGGSEFITIMPFLRSSKLGKTISGQQELVSLVGERAEIDKGFDRGKITLEDDINRIIMCVDYVLPLFNANVQSTNFLMFYCDEILPLWNTIGKLKDGETAKIQLLRQLAELSIHCGKLENPSLHVVQIFDKLKDYMPPPPENADIDEMPNLNFTTVECLLFAFHRLARQCPDFLTADPNVLKDFRARLTYFSRGVQGCKKSLQTLTNSKVDLKKEQTNKAKIAPSVLNNINSLIKDLFYTPPVYKCTVVLSFKTEEGKVVKKIVKSNNSESSNTQKRHVPITFEGNGNAKHPRTNKSGENMKLYQPPSGKFSNNFQSYDRSSGRPRGHRPGGRGTSRGRGRGMWRK